MEITVEFLIKVQKFIESDIFIQFLLNNTTDMDVPTFILQAVHDKIVELENKEYYIIEKISIAIVEESQKVEKGASSAASVLQ